VEALEYATSHLEAVFRDMDEEGWPSDQVKKMDDAIAYLNQLTTHKRQHFAKKAQVQK
jgi:hypothetical protein